MSLLANAFKMRYIVGESEVITMANTTPVYARIDNDLKKNAESILAQLGITPTSAIQMLYSQIVINRGLPFEVKLDSKPTAIGNMNRNELDMELAKGINSGRPVDANKVDAILMEELGI